MHLLYRLNIRIRYTNIIFFIEKGGIYEFAEKL